MIRKEGNEAASTLNQAPSRQSEETVVSQEPSSDSSKIKHTVDPAVSLDEVNSALRSIAAEAFRESDVAEVQISMHREAKE